MTTRSLTAVLSAIMAVSLLTQSTVRAEEPVASADEGKVALVWCLDHFPRFHHYEDVDEPYGSSVDVMKELAKRAGFQLVYTPRTHTARCLKLMEEGKVDLMSNLKYSAERDSFMHMLAYNENVPESIFMLRDDKREISAASTLKQLTLVKIRGYLYSPALMQFFDNNSRHLVNVDTIESGLEMVLRGRVDGLIAPTVSTTDAVNAAASFAHRFRSQPLRLDDSNNYIHIGFSRLSPHQQLLPLLREAIGQMRKDGSITRLYDDATSRIRLGEPVSLADNP